MVKQYRKNYIGETMLGKLMTVERIVGSYRLKKILKEKYYNHKMSFERKRYANDTTLNT